MLALVVGAAVLTGLSPVALRFIVDRIAGQGGKRFATPLALVVLYVLALWIGRTTNELRELVFGAARQRMFRTLSERCFSHLMHLPLRFHLERRTGAMSQTLDNGIEGLRIILHHLVFTYLPVTVELITVLVVLTSMVTPPLLLLFCGAATCYGVAFSYSASAMTKTARRASASRVDAAAVMTDGLLNYETVKYFTAESLVEDRVGTALERCESEWVAFYRQYSMSGVAVSGVFAAFLCGTVLYATHEVQRGRMTLGEFVLVNTYMLQIVRPVEMLGYALQGLSHGGAMLEKLVQLFGQPIESRLRAGTGGVAGLSSLEFQEVSATYGGGRMVLDKVSFRVPAGHTLGIVGPSGSGKSTIIRLLMRLLDPDEGRVLLDGKPISEMDIEELRKSIAVVPQDPMLFADSLRYNIMFGRMNARPEEIEEAARVAQLHEFVMTLPDRYDTLVGERGVKLSGGERQRVSIARAILKGPKIYVFDEATSSLDSRTEQGILGSIRAIASSNTTLVIAHRLSSVVHADEIVVLENGRVVERGAHQWLLRQNGGYAALWKAQLGAAGGAAAA